MTARGVPTRPGVEGRRTARRRRSAVARLWGAVVSPAAAFAVLFPTIGYYTFAAYVNVFAPDGSAGSIAIRIGSLALLLVVLATTPRFLKDRLPVQIVFATIFIVMYSLRIAENMFLQDMHVPPSNNVVVLIFFLSTVLPAYLLSMLIRGLRDENLSIFMAGIIVLFLGGVFLNRDILTDLGNSRLTLDKINPISLSYVCSSIALYLLVFFRRSHFVKVGALAVVPILLVIIALARSRGMMIASVATIAIYVLALRGARRLWVG
jgi:hypothetical protein